MKTLICIILLCVLSAQAGIPHELLPYNPIANPSAVVRSGNARFSVLTPSVIRMEYSTTGNFEDRATIAFVNRYLPVPQFTTTTSNGVLTINTSNIQLRYVLNSPFSSNSLFVSSVGTTKPSFNWHFGMHDDGNLLGTIKSLDMVGVVPLNCTLNANMTIHNEELHCEWALMSRNGWSVVNDSSNWGLDSNDWWQTPNTDLHDLYFFGHGFNYTGALADYSLIGGKIPMLPRQANGIWWSRWYNLNNYDVKGIVNDYQLYQFPLDVFILDMDWHTKQGWGGYTFDTRLFPIPEATMGWLHDQGLHNGANLHDDDGVRPTEKMYRQFAQALGYNPNGGETIYPMFVNQTYMYALEDIVLQDDEKQGMDFWWIDWQQGGKEGGCHGGKQNPTIILNQVRSTDNIRRGSNLRGIVLARWGGLGNHRYQTGFSGDVDYVDWQNLAYQPYFSFTASNVGYGFWSHDIVGSNNDHELHTRWIQWGAYSGTFRTHDRGMAVGGCANSNPPTCAIVEVWNVPRDYLEANRKAMHARAELIPYIYTAQRQAFESGVSLLRPMYYYYPQIQNAYLGDENGNFGQYFFGDDIMVAPVTVQGQTNTSMAQTTIWVPPGLWYEKESGVVINGGSTSGRFLAKSWDLSQIPVFYRAGAIVPTVPLPVGNMIGIAQRQYTTLVLNIYPGKTSGSTTIYEDDGQTTDYLKGQYTYTTVNYYTSNTATQTKLTVNIQRPQGSYPQFPTARNYFIKVVNHLPVLSGTVNGIPLSYTKYGGENTWTYDGPELTTIIQTAILPTSQETVVTITTDLVVVNTMSSIKGALKGGNLAKEVLDETNDTPGSFTVSGGALDILASTADLLTYLAGTDANTFKSTLRSVPSLYEAALAEVNGLKPVPSSALVQLWDSDRQDNCLCASSGCLSSNTQYQQVRIEGYQPPANTPGTVSLNDYWNQNINDNYATTSQSVPQGYTAAVFGDGIVFSSQQSGTVPLMVYWNEQRKDMLTVASSAGIQYAQQNNYQLVHSNIGYVYSSPPNEEPNAVVYDRWAHAWELLINGQL